MSFEAIQHHCLSKPLVEETFPFDDRTMVWKVAGKMFCLADVIEFESLNLKCDPDWAIELREQHEQIQPGYHMNKSLWNTVYLGGLPLDFVFQLIDHSYEQVVKKLPKKIQTEIENL